MTKWENQLAPSAGPDNTHLDAEVASVAAFVVEEFMLNGYVGIVSRRGLCQIQIERHEALQRICRTATLAKQSPRIGFWATLPEETARHISTLVLHGECQEALRILNQAAREGGHLLPLHQ